MASIDRKFHGIEFHHPRLVATAIFLFVVVTVFRYARRGREEVMTVADPEQQLEKTLTNDKLVLELGRLADLPPPLRSVYRHNELPTPYPGQPTVDLETAVGDCPMGMSNTSPWRRHSNSHSTLSPSTRDSQARNDILITDLGTQLYPLERADQGDVDTADRPSRRFWRRRTLIFEGVSAPGPTPNDTL